MQRSRHFLRPARRANPHEFGAGQISVESPLEDLLAAVEHSFDFRLDQATRYEIETVGELYQQALTAMSEVPSRGGCVKMRVFHVIRRALVEGAGLSRADITPDVNFKILIPKRFRRRLWCNFMHRLPWDYSSVLYLRFPAPVRDVAGFLGIACMILVWPVLVSTILNWNMLPALLCTIITFVGCITVLASEPNNPLATKFAKTLDTPRKVTNYIASYRYAEVAKQLQDWNETELWSVFNFIILQDFYLKNGATINRETRFADLYFLD